MAASASASPPLPDAYNLRSLAQPRVLHDVQSCVGQAVDSKDVTAFVAQGLAARDDNSAKSLQLSKPQARAVAVAATGQWACVALSAEGVPLWPLETLHGLVVPVGVPANVNMAWRRNMLAQVARDGVGRGLIVYPSGDADQVHLIAEPRQTQNIKLSTRLLPAGSFDVKQYAAVLQHPGIERLVTRSVDNGQGTPLRLAIPPHRLLKAVDGGFVRLEPTETTRRYAFTGTTWVFAGGQGQVHLQADGTVLMTASAKSPVTDRVTPSSGADRWRLADGVLQLSMADGTRYALTLNCDGTTMTGVARRVEVNADQDEGSEWQWPAQLLRQGAPTGPDAGKWQQASASAARLA